MKPPHNPPTKPLLRYFGGKFRLAAWIIEHMPEHRIYVEPFGGAASVLLQKERAPSEIYNDLDSEVVHLFRVLRDPQQFAELHRCLRYTPFSRADFEAAYVVTDEPIERARNMLIRSWMGHAGMGVFERTGYRSNVKSDAIPARDWTNLINSIEDIVDRLRGVNIECQPAGNVIIGHDTPETLFYVDPPYPVSTRGKKRYAYEMCDDDHRQLAQTLHGVEGMVILSGYGCELYDDELFPSWKRLTRDTHANWAKARTEVLWLNPACQHALERIEAAADPIQMELNWLS